MTGGLVYLTDKIPLKFREASSHVHEENESTFMCKVLITSRVQRHPEVPLHNQKNKEMETFRASMIQQWQEKVPVGRNLEQNQTLEDRKELETERQRLTIVKRRY